MRACDLGCCCEGRIEVMRCSESTSERSYAGWRLLLKGERRASVPGLSVWLMKK